MAQYWEWLVSLSETRTAILVGRCGIGDSDTLTGSYNDGFGGHMDIVQKGEQLFFRIEVVRGPTYHLGGIAQQNYNMSRYTDAEVVEPEKLKNEGETWVTFIEKSTTGQVLEVIGTNTGSYHGLRAYFSGKYVRVSELDAKEQATVVKSAQSGEWEGEAE